MNNYIPIKAVLSRVPKSVRRETDDLTLIMHMLDVYEMINSPSQYEEVVEILKLVDHKASLPDDVKKITLISYMSQTLHQNKN